jgi:hypothetical protein
MTFEACVIADGDWPSRQVCEEIGLLAGGHDVSHHWRVGAHDEVIGIAPRAKTSMRMIVAGLEPGRLGALGV